MINTPASSESSLASIEFAEFCDLGWLQDLAYMRSECECSDDDEIRSAVGNSSLGRFLKTSNRTERHSQETVDATSIEFALAKSDFPLKNVRCHILESTIVLSGTVSRYHHLQVALQIALRMSARKEIVSNIEVLPSCASRR